MEVTAKNCAVAKTYISKLSFNAINNILACNIDGNDAILFYSLDEESMTFLEIFKGMSRPPGSKISLKWSPDGRYLALGAANIELWELKDKRIRPLKTISEDFIQIKQIQWSVDSLCYAIGGISRTNTIKIRNIETSKLRQIKLQEHLTMSSISFDPFGKYMFVLLRNNTVQVYSTSNYQKQKEIPLSPKHIKVSPIRQVRISSWSPDFNNFVCPSLDDSRLNIALCLSRSQDFKVNQIFVGHCSTISCCSFNPKLFRHQNYICSIIAMGDSSGNISIWRIVNSSSNGGKKDINPVPDQKPLLLSNSVQNSNQVVEDIEWNSSGDFLMINMLKKYINVMKFNKKVDFGQELTNEETFALIQDTYGARRANDMNMQNIEVFNGGIWQGQEQAKGQIQIAERERNQIVTKNGVQIAKIKPIQQTNTPAKKNTTNRQNIQSSSTDKKKQLNNAQQNNKEQQQNIQFINVDVNDDNNEDVNVLSLEEQREILMPTIITMTDKDKVSTTAIDESHQSLNPNSYNENNKIHSESAAQQGMQIQPNQPQPQPKITTGSLSSQCQPHLQQNSSFVQNPTHAPDVMIKMSEQKTFFGKNNRKKIQPAVMIRKNQSMEGIGGVQGMARQASSTTGTFFAPSTSFDCDKVYKSSSSVLSHPQLHVPPTYFTNSMVQTLPSLNLPQMSFNQRSIKLSPTRVLEIKRISKATNVQLIDTGSGSGLGSVSSTTSNPNPSPISQRFFPSNIQCLQVSSSHIYIQNQGFLYIFNHELSPTELPIKTGQLHQLQINSKGDVYYVSCDGYLFGFNHKKDPNVDHYNCCLTPAPVPLHVILIQKQKSQQKNQLLFQIKQFTVAQNGNIYFGLEGGNVSSSGNGSDNNADTGLNIGNSLNDGNKQNGNINSNNCLNNSSHNNNRYQQNYMFDQQKNSWVRLGVKDGRLEQGHSLKISESQENMAANFFKIMCPSFREKQQSLVSSNSLNPNHSHNPYSAQHTTQSVINQAQQNMIYHSKYNKSESKYADSLLAYLKFLKNSNNAVQLRNFLYQHFFNSKSLNYLSNPIRNIVYPRVKQQLGGQIVEQFEMLQNNSALNSIIQEE